MLTALVAAFALIAVTAAAIGAVVVLRAVMHGHGRVPDGRPRRGIARGSRTQTGIAA